MADLTVALIVRYVDRMSAGAQRSMRSLAGLTSGQKAFSVSANVAAKSNAGVLKASQAAAAGHIVVAKSAVTATLATSSFAKTSDLLTQSSNGLTSSTRAAGQAAEDTGRQQMGAGRATEAAGRQAETGARRFNLLEKSQMRAAAATRMLKTRAEALEGQLTKLAVLSIGTEGLERAGHFLGHPIAHAVGEAANFAGGMTGFGITAEMSDAQMAPIRKAILAAANKYAITPEQALETFAFTRRSGVFKKPAEIIAAGGEAARFQKLAERMGSPVDGEEAAGGASSAVREYGFAATPAGIRRYYAMIDAAEKTGGGMKMDDLLRYSRSSGGLMKSFGAGNAGGLADVLAAQQVSMFLAHSGGQAGINVQDLLTTISHKMTVRRFKKEGVDLPAVIQGAWKQGMSPLEAFSRLVMKMTEGKEGPARQFAIGHLIGNQQAAQSLMALAQNMDKFAAYRQQIMGQNAGKQYDGDVRRVLTDPKTVMERWAVAKSNLSISAGVLLLPAATKLATVLTRLVDLITRFADRGGAIGKVAMLGVAGLAGLAIGAGALGHVLIGVLAPLYIMRTLFKDIIPLSAELGKAKAIGWMARASSGARAVAALPGRAAAGVWRMAGAGSDLLGGAAGGGFRALRRAPGALRAGAGAAFRAVRAAPAAALRMVTGGATGGLRLVQRLAAGGAGALGRMAGAVRAFSFGSMISGLRGAAAGMLAFARSGRLGALAMNIMKFSVRGVLAASGIGLLILAAGFLVEHWRGVVTFFQGFGKGFMKAIAPVRPALQPLINIVKMAADWIGKLFGGGKGKGGAEDWSSWGEKAGAAIGGVVTALAGLLGWLGKVIEKGVEFWAKLTGHAAAGAGAAALAASAAAAAPPPKPQQVVTPPSAAAPQSAPAKGPAAGQPIPQHVEQHFHMNTPQPDPKKLAAEMQRQAAAGQRRAAYDGNDG